MADHERLSRQMESITAEFYRILMADAKKSGISAADIDEYVTSFCIDNLMIMLQFSHASAHYRERLKIFAGDDSLENDEKIIRGMMRFVLGALGPMGKKS